MPKLNSEKQKIVFLHGWACDESVWQPTLSENSIKENFDCRTFLLPGHGENPKVKWDTPDLTPATNMLLEETKDEEGLIGVGWSLGGQVLLDIASKDQSKFKKLVLVSVSPKNTRSDDYPFGRSPALVRRMMKEIEASGGEYIKKFFEPNFTKEELMLPEVQTFITHNKKVADNLDKNSIYCALKSLYEKDLRGLLSKITVPTLIIQSSKDIICNIENGKYLKEHIKDSTLEIFEEAGHIPFISNPEKFNNILIDFLK